MKSLHNTMFSENINHPVKIQIINLLQMKKAMTFEEILEELSTDYFSIYKDFIELEKMQLIESELTSRKYNINYKLKPFIDKAIA